MPTIPKTTNASPSTIDIMNALRLENSMQYQIAVPEADQSNVRQIGSVLLGAPALLNEWYSSLLNRVALVMVTSKAWRNPWSFMRRGDLELGETVEEIFVGLVDGYKRDLPNAEKLVFKRRYADVRSAFHVENFQAYYPLSIDRHAVRKAFLSWDALGDFISAQIEAVYTSWEYDEFNLMKYMLGNAIINGEMHFENGITFDAAGAKGAVTAVKAMSNALLFMSPNYNLSGVPNHTPRDDQFLIINTRADAVMDVEVLAAAFHMEKTEFSGHHVMVDDFATVDEARLSVLLSNEDTGETTFTPWTAAEKTLLGNVQAVMLSREWGQIYGNLREMDSIHNPMGLYDNYYLHIWQTFSYSPFANAIAFVSSAAATISSVTGTVDSVTARGDIVTLTIKPNVTLSGLGSKAVSFVQTDALTAANITVSPYGVVTMPADSDGKKLTITVDGAEYESSAAVTPSTALGATITFAAV